MSLFTWQRRALLSALVLVAVIETICMSGCSTFGTNPETYTLTTTISPSNGGTVSRNPNQASYTSGTTVTVTATASNNYIFTQWSGAATGTTSSVAVTMNSNKTLTANFQRTYTLTTNVSPSGGGSISRSPSGSSYASGTTVTVTATASSGYKFTGWSGAATGATNPTTITMNDNKTLTANFVQYGTLTYGGQTYKTVVIGGKRWMAENLNYQTSSGSWCYSNTTSNCTKYGRLYDWNTAMAGSSSSTKNPSGVQGVCPTGWHLPSRGEWADLVSVAGLAAGRKLKSTSGWGISGNFEGTDDYGFSALPGGIRKSYTFSDEGGYGFWWTATEITGDFVYYRHMSRTSGTVGENDLGAVLKDFGLSVRCIQN